MDATLCISDVHVGKKTQTYNSTVFKERLNNLCDKYVKTTKQLGTFNEIDNLNIFILGDIIDGELVYPTQAHHIEMDIDDAVDIAVNEFTYAVSGIQEELGLPLNIYTVRGNHGRTGRFNSEKTNWDTVFYKRLNDRLFINSKIVLNITDDWYNTANICGHKFLIIHGEMIRAYEGIPFYGINKKVGRWYTGGIPAKFNNVVLGHFHTCYDEHWNDIRIMGNGTFVTDDDFSQRLGFKSVTKMLYFLSSEKEAIELMTQIDVTE